MAVIRSLEGVELEVFSPKLMLLLSKYAHELKKHNGLVLKFKSKSIFDDVHRASLLADSDLLQDLYQQALFEVNIQLAENEGRLVDEQLVNPLIMLRRAEQASLAAQEKRKL